MDLMNTLGKVCIFLAVFGALNWVTLGTWEADLITSTLGPTRTVGTDMVRIVVALGSLYVLVRVFLRR